MKILRRSATFFNLRVNFLILILPGIPCWFSNNSQVPFFVNHFKVGKNLVIRSKEESMVWKYTFQRQSLFWKLLTPKFHIVKRRKNNKLPTMPEIWKGEKLFTLKLDILSILLKQIFHLNIIQNFSIEGSHPNFISSVPKFWKNFVKKLSVFEFFFRIRIRKLKVRHYMVSIVPGHQKFI